MNTGFRTRSTQLNALTDLDRWLEGWDVPASAGYGEFRGDISTNGQQFNMIDLGTGLNGSLVEFDGISITTNKTVYIQVLANTYPSGDATAMPRLPGFDWRQDVNGSIVIPGHFFSMGQMQYRVNVLQKLGESGINITDLEVTANLINLRRAANSSIRAADKLIYNAGDSVTALTSVGTRAYRPAAFHIFQVRNAINDAYAAEGSLLNIRMVNKAIGSQTSFDFVKYIESELATIPQCDIFMLCYGINEAINNMDTTLFRSYLQIIWNWFKREYRDRHMVIVGSTPLNNNTNEARLVIHRATMAQFVADMDDERLTYVSMENAFDRTVLGNYTSSDGVHPGTPACWDAMAAIQYNHILNNAHCRSVLQLSAA